MRPRRSAALPLICNFRFESFALYAATRMCYHIRLRNQKQDIPATNLQARNSRMNTSNSERLLSLDALRGFDMLFIMGLAAVVTGLCSAFGFGGTSVPSD